MSYSFARPRARPAPMSAASRQAISRTRAAQAVIDAIISSPDVCDVEGAADAEPDAPALSLVPSAKSGVYYVLRSGAVLGTVVRITHRVNGRRTAPAWEPRTTDGLKLPRRVTRDAAADDLVRAAE